MILVRIVGGLGNQLFQYAIGRTLAEKYNTNLILDLRYYDNYKPQPYLLDHFKCKFEKATKKDIKSITYLNKYFHKVNKWFNKRKPVSERRIIANYDPGYFDDIFEIDPPVYIEGYWQSPKYFQDISSIIRDECRISKDPNGPNKKFAEKIQNENSISIHIRRGDYITNKAANEKHGVCSMNYYKRAIRKIEEKVPDPTYYIFSDDKEWVLEHFTMLSEAHFMTFNDIDEAQEDLRLMYSCKHHIIANSTFSWWGAWLNQNPDKIVIAPQNWFKGLNTSINDMIPSAWHEL